LATVAPQAKARTTTRRRSSVVVRGEEAAMDPA
jgi:hypothetical protein